MYLEIKKGFSIDTKEIKAIARVTEFTSRIFTEFGEFDADFPYSTLLSLVDRDQSKPDKDIELKKKLDGFLSNVGHFAG